jgi:hypothetical protein
MRRVPRTPQTSPRGIMLVFLYFLMALLVGWLGRDREIGFVGFFIVALFITPLIALLILMVTHKRSRPAAS